MMSPDQEAGYGAAQKAQMLRRERKIVQELERPPIGVVIGCVVVPTLIFIFTFLLLSFNVRFSAKAVAFVGALVLFAACLAFGAMAVLAAMGKVTGNPVWLGILCVYSLGAWTFAFIDGNMTYHNNMDPYYQLQTMNVYETVNPSTSEGNQYMDAGVINFAEGSWIDRMYTMAFINDDVYCVAPIKFETEAQKTYDYWAVGTNCCSKHLFNFNCGMWNNPAARSGIRVMNDKDRSFFRLAVEQASAAYDIPTHHPVFVQWVQSPTDQILGMEEEAYKALYLGTFYTFFCTLFFTFLAGWCLPHFPKALP
jgi:hypothetical protein